jgi:hypothetical protein
MKTMSCIPRLITALCVVFIFATGSAINITAQTSGEDPFSKTPASSTLTIKSKNLGYKLPWDRSVENPTRDKSSEVSKDPENSNGAAGVNLATGPTVTAKATTSSWTAPRPPQTVNDDKWQFQLSPYFWFAGLNGTAGTANRTAQVGESFRDVFDALNFAFMGTFEARKGKFISLTDLEYVSVSDEKATPGPLFSTLDAGFKSFIFDQEVGYRFYDNDHGASIDVLGGARVWHVSTDFEFGAGILPAVRIDGSRNWVDGVGGLRAKAPLSEKWFVTGKFDLGGGGSKFTWQAFGGAGYRFNEKVALIFGYRALDVNYDKDNFVYDMNQRGPIVGLGFRF